MNTSKKYSPEARQRAVRMVLDHERYHPSEWVTIRSVAEKIAGTAETLRGWVRQAEQDQDRRAGLTTDHPAPHHAEPLADGVSVERRLRCQHSRAACRRGHAGGRSRGFY